MWHILENPDPDPESFILERPDFDPYLNPSLIIVTYAKSYFLKLDPYPNSVIISKCFRIKRVLKTGSIKIRIRNAGRTLGLYLGRSLDAELVHELWRHCANLVVPAGLQTAARSIHYNRLYEIQLQF